MASRHRVLAASPPSTVPSAELDVDRYFGFPMEVRRAFDDWALSEGVNLGDLRVRAVRLGEGVIECERYVDVPRSDRLEWHAYPVKTVPPLEMFLPAGSQ